MILPINIVLSFYKARSHILSHEIVMLTLQGRKGKDYLYDQIGHYRYNGLIFTLHLLRTRR